MIDRFVLLAIAAAIALAIGTSAGYALAAKVYGAKLATQQAAAAAREADVQRMLADQQAQAARALESERAAASRAVRARDTAQREANLTRAALAAHLEEVRRDPAVVAWGAQPLPPAVADSLRFLPAEARPAAGDAGRQAPAAGGAGLRLPAARPSEDARNER